MEIKINNKHINVQLPPQELEHSLMYSLLYCRNIKENLEAETQRIKADLELLEGLLALDMEQIILVTRMSTGEKDLLDKLTAELHLNRSQAAYIANLELNEWISFDFKQIKRYLLKYLRFLEILIAEK
jgi:hypothetical protein